MLKRLPVTIAALVLILVAAYTMRKLLTTVTVVVPEYRQPGELVELNQGWTNAQRLQFHHTSQGTKLVPYAWFKVLEQPCFSLIGCEEFRNPHYLSRFGFLASEPDPKSNPDGLPVGFAYQEDFHDPILQKTYPALGLTCAACH